MPHISVSELDHHWFRLWLVACSAPSHYLTQCWFIVNWTLGNKFWWDLNWEFCHFHIRKCIWKCCLQNSGHFVLVSVCQWTGMLWLEAMKRDGHLLWRMLAISLHTCIGTLPDYLIQKLLPGKPHCHCTKYSSGQLDCSADQREDVMCW